MNERIKQLIKEAGFSDDFIDDCELGYTQQKFAELIIKECMYLLETEPPAHLFTNQAYDRGYHDSRKDAVFILKTHFGIE